MFDAIEWAINQEVKYGKPPSSACLSVWKRITNASMRETMRRIVPTVKFEEEKPSVAKADDAD